MFIYYLILFITTAGPFLQKADTQSDDSCHHQEAKIVTNTSSQLNDDVTRELSDDVTSEFNPVGWTYVMSGAFTLLTGVVMVTLALCKVEDNIKNLSEAKKESGVTSQSKKKAEEPIGDVIWVFVPVLLFYFVIVSLELLYQSYIYSIALCSGLGFTVIYCFNDMFFF